MKKQTVKKKKKSISEKKALIGLTAGEAEFLAWAFEDVRKRLNADLATSFHFDCVYADNSFVADSKTLFDRLYACVDRAEKRELDL